MREGLREGLHDEVRVLTRAVHLCVLPWACAAAARGSLCPHPLLLTSAAPALPRSFTVEYDFYGERRTEELAPGGADVPVTAANRADYVQVRWGKRGA